MADDPIYEIDSKHFEATRKETEDDRTIQGILNAYSVLRDFEERQSRQAEREQFAVMLETRAKQVRQEADAMEHAVMGQRDPQERAYAEAYWHRTSAKILENMAMCIRSHGDGRVHGHIINTDEKESSDE